MFDKEYLSWRLTDVYTFLDNSVPALPHGWCPSLDGFIPSGGISLKKYDAEPSQAPNCQIILSLLGHLVPPKIETRTSNNRRNPEGQACCAGHYSLVDVISSCDLGTLRRNPQFIRGLEDSIRFESTSRFSLITRTRIPSTMMLGHRALGQSFPPHAAGQDGFVKAARVKVRQGRLCQGGCT